MAHDLESDGFAVGHEAVNEHQRAALLTLVMQAPHPIEHPSGVPFASRALLEKIPNLSDVLQSVGLTALASAQLLMRPLTLHRSSPSQDPGHRRVLHVVYAARPPNSGLKWRYSA